MDRDVELELIARCMAAAEAGSPPLHGDEALLDVGRYADADRHARELDRVFRRRPNVLAHVATLAEPGDFLTGELAGVPLLLVRGEAGVAAFINVCRHRGACVELRERGNAKRFVCPYHAWTYDHAGALVHLRHREGFPRLDPRSSGLVALPCVELGGLVWVTASPDAGLELDMPAAYADELRGLELDALEPWAVEVRDWRANWKLIADGGLEGYHFKVAHRRSIAKLFLDTVSDFEFFGPHTRSVYPRANLVELAAQPRGRWRLRDCANVLYNLFPNATLLVQSDHIVLVASTPLAVDRTRVEIHTLVPKGERGGPRAGYWDANHALTVRTLAEDFELAEQIQRGLLAGANTHVRIGRFEAAITSLHAYIDGLL